MAEITLKINHKDLARLLDAPLPGESPEGHDIFVRFGEQIIQEFAKRHLRSLVTTDAMLAVKLELREELDTIVDDSLRGYDETSKVVQLKPGVRQTIRNAAVAEVGRVIEETIADRLQNMDIGSIIGKAVDYYVSNETARRLREKTETAWKQVEEVDQRVHVAGGVANTSLDDIVAANSMVQKYGVPFSHFINRHSEEDTRE